MEITIGLTSFIVGIIVGFVLFKLMGGSSQESSKLAEQVNQSEQALEKYKSEVAEHLDSSAKLLDQMHSTCKDAMAQMAQSTKLLQEATPEESASMPFFSQETQEQLAETVQLRHSSSERKEDVKITEAPLDYSGNPSGLFDNSTQNVTKPKEENKELS
jgi:uncharacterized membrane-anchored protein YhcB (DUF1043 family)